MNLDKLLNETAQHTQEALKYMAEYGIVPEGQVQLFRPPTTRQAEIHTIPYPHGVRQVVSYQTEAGEFSACCPFSGLPDYGTLKVEYVPGTEILELKSLKYYLISWRNIGAAQEDVTAIIFKDLQRFLSDAEYIRLETVYNVRGGILTKCHIDSREI
jgi:7-cyano-7-deazaguanine reductase